MEIVIAGGTGFIGHALVSVLSREHRALVLSRDAGKVRAGQPLIWNPGDAGAWRTDVARADVIINLAGASIGEGRWTAGRRRQILESRVRATEALTSAVRDGTRRDQTFISASAIGHYGSRGEEILDESSGRGTDFLAEVTQAWEAGAETIGDLARLVILRFGMVLAGDGGALPQLARPMIWFAGGRIGDGRQWMSWVDRGDLIRAVQWTIGNARSRGIYNVTAPNPVRNSEFIRTLASVLHRPALFPAPAPLLRIALGKDKADALLLASQRVLPRRLLQDGFEFQFPELQTALERAFGRSPRI